MLDAEWNDCKRTPPYHLLFIYAVCYVNFEGRK